MIISCLAQLYASRIGLVRSPAEHRFPMHLSIGGSEHFSFTHCAGRFGIRAVHVGVHPRQSALLRVSVIAFPLAGLPEMLTMGGLWITGKPLGWIGGMAGRPIIGFDKVPSRSMA